DWSVTGVQTCALPILGVPMKAIWLPSGDHAGRAPCMGEDVSGIALVVSLHEVDERGCVEADRLAAECIYPFHDQRSRRRYSSTSVPSHTSRPRPSSSRRLRASRVSSPPKREMSSATRRNWSTGLRGAKGLIMSEKWAQLNCSANGCTIRGSGKTSAKRTILKRLRREKPRPNSASNCALHADPICSPYSARLLLHHVVPDAPPHVPIERGKARIHGPRYAFAGVQDQFPQVSEPAWTPAAGLEACPTTPPTSRSSPYPWPPTASHCPPPATWPARQWRGNRRPSPASRSSPRCAGFSTCAGSACVAACPPLPLPLNIRSRRAAAARP